MSFCLVSKECEATSNYYAAEVMRRDLGGTEAWSAWIGEGGEAAAQLLMCHMGVDRDFDTRCQNQGQDLRSYPDMPHV